MIRRIINLKNSLKNAAKYLAIAFYLGVSICSQQVSAFVVDDSTTDGGGIGKSKLVTGAVKIIKDVTAIAAGIALIVTVCFSIIQFIKMQTTDEEGEAIAIKKRIKKIITYGALATVGSTLISTILKYFA